MFSRLVFSIRRVRTEFGVTEFAGVFENFSEMYGFTMIFGVAFFIKKLVANGTLIAIVSFQDKLVEIIRNGEI